MYRIVAIGFMVFALPSLLRSAPLPTDNRPLPADLDLVPRNAAAFATVRPHAMFARRPDQIAKLDGFEQRIQAGILGCPLDEFERLTIIFPPDELPPIDTSVKRPFPVPDPPFVYEVPPEFRYATYVFTARKPFRRLPYQLDRTNVLTRFCKDEMVTVRHRGRTFMTDADGWTSWLTINDRTVVLGSRASIEWIIDHSNGQTAPGPLEPALRLAEKECDLVIGVRPAIGWHWIADRFPTSSHSHQAHVLNRVAAEWLSDSDKTPPMAGKRKLPEWLALGLDASGKGKLRLMAGFTNATERDRAPTELQPLRDAILERAKEQIGTSNAEESEPIRQLVESIRRMAPPQVHDNSLAIEWAVPGDYVLAELGLIGWEFEPFTVEMTTSTVSNDLTGIATSESQLIKAFDAYHAKHGHYPPAAITSADGKPLLSWRVALLPYLGFEKLYGEFKLDEPWDSPTNRRLLERIPWVYSGAMTRRYRHRPITRYQVGVGPGTLFGDGKSWRKVDITSGPEATILFVETDRSVPWTQPAEVMVGEGKRLSVNGKPARIMGFSTAAGKDWSNWHWLVGGNPPDLTPYFARAGKRKDIVELQRGNVAAEGTEQIGFYLEMLRKEGLEIPPPRKKP